MARRIVVDANVFLSFLVDRNERQRTAARALLESAEDGEIVAVVTQFALFEIVYVMQSVYGTSPADVAELLRDLLALPGLTVTDDCPWKKVFDSWPDPIAGLADAALVAVAIANRCDAVATFDAKMVRRMQRLHVPSYW